LKLLILGSEGFIGSNAVRYFAGKGYDVYSADIILKEYEKYFLINPEYPDFSGIFMQHKFDFCINATGAANVQLSFSHPLLDFVLNTANVFRILNSIREYNPCCKYLNLSSAAVYGNPAVLPIKEDAALKPLSPYGFHKLYSEQICKEFFELYKVAALSIRIFSAYGEGLQKQLFWDLYKKADASNSNIELFGTGNETRDFIYIQDLLVAIECVIKNAIFDGTAVNVASGEESSIKAAVELFLAAQNKNIKAYFLGNQKIGDPLYWRADISLLKTFGFKPSFSLKQGINNYCQWVQEKQSL
jgi:UDP-glucose 4-epimerase